MSDQNQTGGVIDRAASELIAHAIASKSSREVDTLLEELADGRVKVFGEVFGEPPGGSRARRTEIQIDGALVVIHKNTLQAGGAFAAAARFSEVEVVRGARTSALQIKVDTSTSPTNPVYVFLDGINIVGRGYGQRMDLRIATDLLDVFVGGLHDHVSLSVINWIRDQIEAGS